MRMSKPNCQYAGMLYQVLFLEVSEIGNIQHAMPREVHANRRTRLIVIAGKHFSRDWGAKCYGEILETDGVEVCTDTECMSSLESEARLFRK